MDLLAGGDDGTLADTAESVDTSAGDDARTEIAFESGPAEDVVAARLLGTAVGADGEDVTGGNPKNEPAV